MFGAKVFELCAVTVPEFSIAEVVFQCKRLNVEAVVRLIQKETELPVNVSWAEILGRCASAK